MLSRKKISFQSWVVALLIAATVLVPASARLAAAEQTLLKVALLIPRTPEGTIELKRYNDKIGAMTNGAVQVRIYWGGAAGDEKDVLRKMRLGQIDGTQFTVEVMSNFVREALVLQSPALFENYAQVDAVRAELTPEFDKEAYANGFKVMGWADVGRIRILSKQKITKISDFKKVRPWLFPESEILKEFYKLIGATGVPMGIPEVYGGLETGMIDTVWSSAVLAGALQWHRSTKYISARGLGFISGAFVFRKGAWDGLPKDIQESMTILAKETKDRFQPQLRSMDEKSLKALLSRGFEALQPDNIDEWYDVGSKLRQRMVGRVYTKELVSRAEAIAKKYEGNVDRHRKFD
jgi:TRAP-type transport system periplasmic protein